MTSLLTLSSCPSSSLATMLVYVMKRGACKPCTFSMGGQWVAPGGPQSWRPRELAKRWVRRWAILKPPLPSNCVNTIITCLKFIEKKKQINKTTLLLLLHFKSSKLTFVMVALNPPSSIPHVLRPHCSSRDSHISHESICSRDDSLPLPRDQPNPTQNIRTNKYSMI